MSPSRLSPSSDGDDIATFWAIDRLGDHGWAVLENDQGVSVRIPRSWLPEAAREGSVLRAESGAADGLREDAHSIDLRLLVDREETERRRNQAEELRENLPRGPEGDLEL